MPKKKKNKGGGRPRPGGRGSGSGGRGAGRGNGGTGRGPMPGVLRNMSQKSGRQLDRRALVHQRRQEHKQRRKAGANGNIGAHLGKVVEEVRDDGFLRHQEIPRAHQDAIMAILMAEDAIYTASRDKILKRWKVGRNPGTNRFELATDLEVPLGDLCWAMTMAGEWIFCGLGDGTIKGYSKTGGQAVLKAHTKRVQCLKVHAHVLISGGSDGSVRLWQADPTGQNFACTNTITEGISSGVSCMAILAEHLWVGGTSGASVIELASLRVVSQIEPKKFVVGMQEFQGHMIVAYADGQMCIFDVGGGKKLDQPPMQCGPLMAVAGLECGPRLLCGHSKGQVSSIVLPDFTLKVSFQALEKCKVQSLACANGPDGIFILGAENGNLQVWQRDPTMR